MPKRTLKQVMELHGITRDVLDAAKQKGVNVWNDAEMKIHLAETRHRLQPGAKLDGRTGAGSAQSIEEMEDAIRRSKSIDDVKILKEKLAALKIALQVRTENRELVPVGEARESMTRFVSIARGELLKLSTDLPPRLAGLSEAKSQAIIRDEIIEILGRLSDSTSKLYEEEK